VTRRGRRGQPGSASTPGPAPAHISISALARRFGLSRSTLLYYDRLNLLKPATRTSANYRLYSAADAERLERIGRYRQAGLALAAIRRLLDARESDLADALTARLGALNEELHRLREQQRFIVGLLGRRSLLEKLAFMSRRTFVGMLDAAGFTQDDMLRWHAAFERTAPEQHERFLQFLCIPDDEIRRIRKP
jgi:MerR family transcriptional regulator, thiopeptide resistance regulator